MQFIKMSIPSCPQPLAVYSVQVSVVVTGTCTSNRRNMKTSEQIANQQTPRLALMFGAVCLTLFFTFQSQAFPVTQVTFKDNAPFTAVNQTTAAPLTSSDGLLTVAGWADLNATVPAKL